MGGLEHFIPYMKSYVKTFNGRSITTAQWREHLFSYFGGLDDAQTYLKKLGRVDWDAVSGDLHNLRFGAERVIVAARGRTGFVRGHAV